MPTTNQMIQKGTISSIEGEIDRNGNKTKARILPGTADGAVTRPLTIPWWLRGDMGNLSPGVEVAFALFEDATGVILTRMDGDWGGIIPGNVTIAGDLTLPAGDINTASVNSYNNHTHGGIESGSGTTQPPK